MSKLYSNLDEAYIRFNEDNKVEIMKLLLSHKYTFVYSEWGAEYLFATSNPERFDEYECGYDERKIFIQDNDTLDNVARCMKYRPLELDLPNDRYLIGYKGLFPDGINTKENYFVVLGASICISHIRPNKNYDNNFREINIDELKELVANPEMVVEQHYPYLLDLKKLEEYAKDYDTINSGGQLRLLLSNPNAVFNGFANYVSCDFDDGGYIQMGISDRYDEWKSFLLPVECKNEEVAQTLCDEFVDKVRELYSITQEGDDVYFDFGLNYTPEKFELFNAMQDRAKELNGDWEGGLNKIAYYVQLEPNADTKAIDLKVVPKYGHFEFNLPLMYNRLTAEYNPKHDYIFDWF